MKIAVIVLSVAVLLLGGIDYSVDRTFRHLRDFGCDKQEKIEALSLEGLQFHPARLASWEVMRFEFTDGKNSWAVVHFYGCDANGHRYRMWEEKRW